MRVLQRLFQRNLLLKIASYNSIHIAIRIVTGVIMTHLTAVFLGTAGLAVLGNFRNFLQGIQSFSLLGFENGLVSYTARLEKNKKDLQDLFSAAWTITLLVSLCLSVAVFATAHWLDDYLIGYERSYGFVFKGLAVTIPFYVAFIMVSSLLQGMQRYRHYVNVNILINILVFALSALLIVQYKVAGALWAIVATPVVQCAVAFLLWKKARILYSLRSLLKFHWSLGDLKPLWGYSAMALLSALLVPVTYIAVRQDVRFVVGDEAAGNWEGLQRLSNYYMMFVTSLISLYVLPQLSKDRDFTNYRHTIIHFYKTILPLLALGLILLYVGRSWIVTYLYTKEFVGMLPLFKWQFAGDFIKIITTVMAFRFIAINDFKRYAIAEVVSLASFYITNYFFIRNYGSEGVVMAHLASHLFFMVALVILLRRELFK